jgi:hypothetical protein
MAKKKQFNNRRKKASSSIPESEFETGSSHSQHEIIETLSELSGDIDTYEFLGELFFEFLANEVRTTSPSPERLNLYINTRHQIHQLYELARAAKALRAKTRQHQQLGD